jgi:hypothetical protein
LAGAQIAIARALAVTIFATANLPLIIKNPPQFVPHKFASKRDAYYVNDSKKAVTAVQQTSRFDFGLSLQLSDFGRGPNTHAQNSARRCNYEDFALYSLYSFGILATLAVAGI